MNTQQFNNDPMATVPHMLDINIADLDGHTYTECMESMASAYEGLLDALPEDEYES